MCTKGKKQGSPSPMLICARDPSLSTEHVFTMPMTLIRSALKAPVACLTRGVCIACKHLSHITAALFRAREFVTLPINEKSECRRTRRHTYSPLLCGCATRLIGRLRASTRRSRCLSLRSRSSAALLWCAATFSGASPVARCQPFSRTFCFLTSGPPPLITSSTTHAHLP